MTNRQPMHIVDRDPRQRAALAHRIFSFGYHAEVYEDLSELLSRPPEDGIVLVRDDQAGANGIRGTASVLARLAEFEVWLPVVAMSLKRDVDAVLAAMKAGVLDFLILPMADDSLAEALRSVRDQAERIIRKQRKIIDARQALGRLSPREREVLQCLTDGCSNKEIAGELEISPRTVEIHRANMMLKLSAGHPADALRLQFEAQLDGGEIRTMRKAHRYPDSRNAKRMASAH